MSLQTVSSDLHYRNYRKAKNRHGNDLNIPKMFTFFPKEAAEVDSAHTSGRF